MIRTGVPYLENGNNKRSCSAFALGHQHITEVEYGSLKTAELPLTLASRYGLSDREAEIMLWLKIGKTNYEIGRILEISACTVRNHLQRIFRKLLVFNRTHAVAKFFLAEQEGRN